MALNYPQIPFERFADDLVILVDGHPKWDWLEQGVYKHLLEELATLDVSLNVEKAKREDLARGEGFPFLGF